MTEPLRGLDVVRVDTQTVVETLKENLKAHVSTYKTAIKGWEEELRARVQEFGAMSEDLTVEEINDQIHDIRMHYGDKPQNHQSTYEQYIAMLSSSLDDEIELTNKEFSQLMRDDWSWKDRFALSTSKYT